MHNEAGNTVAAVLPTTQLTQRSLTTFVLSLKFTSGQIFFFMATADLIWTKNNREQRTNQSTYTLRDVTAKQRFHLHVIYSIFGTRVTV